MNNKLELLKLSMKYCLTTKLYWTDIIDDHFNHQQALDYAKSLGMRLPNIEELKLAYKNNIIKVDDRWFWSSSVDLKYPNSAISFSGIYGSVSDYHRDNKFSLICVVENI